MSRRASWPARRYRAPRTAGHPRSARHPLPWAALLLALLAALLFPAQARATTYHQRTPEQMVLAADLIFVGTVDAVAVSLEVGTPWTEVTFRVEEWLADARRDAADDEAERPASVTLRFLGGAAPTGERLTVSGTPTYREGQRALVLAYDVGDLASPVVGVRQGTFTIDARGARNEDGAYLSVPAPGRLELGTSGAGVEELSGAMTALLEAGTLPTEELPAAPDSEPAAEPEAGEPDAEPDGEPGSQPASEPEDAPEDAPAAPDPAEPAGGAEDSPGDAPPPVSAPEAPPTLPAPPVTVRYRVDESGGPLLLSEAVTRAAAAWEEAAPEAVDFVAQAAAEADGTAAHTIGYGDAALFGPDALSFTLVRGGSQATEVLVSPTVGELLEPVLLHDLGVLLGLPESGTGVMGGAVSAGATGPTAADVASLRALRTFRPEDINRDGVVDFYDLAALGAAYGTSGVNLPADLNGDGVVDDADLALLGAAYQFLPPAEAPKAP